MVYNTTYYFFVAFMLPRIFVVVVAIVVGIIMIQIYLYIKKETFMYLHNEVLCSLFAICGNINQSEK